MACADFARAETDVRVMLTTIGAHGHFRPLVPLVRALRAAGHELVVATAGAFRGPVEAAGLPLLACGLTTREALPRVRAASETLTAEERSRWIVAEIFVSAIARAALAELPRLVAWKPDVVIREEGEFAGPLIAAKAGVPCAEVGWGPMRPPDLVAAAAAALAPLWREAGLAPEPNGGAYRWLYLDPCPPSLQATHAASVLVAHPVWLQAPARGELPRLDWLEAPRSRPLVYVTLGTVAHLAGDLEVFRFAIDALAGDFELVLTLGPEGDPAPLGQLPAGVRAERFIPRDALLPHCALVISNGGSGSTLGALAHGVPVLCVPALSPSQQRNAAALAASGAGRRVERSELSAARLRAEVEAMRSNDRCASAARRIAGEIRALPPLEHAVRWVERLAREREPITRETVTR